VHLCSEPYLNTDWRLRVNRVLFAPFSPEQFNLNKSVQLEQAQKSQKYWFGKIEEVAILIFKKVFSIGLAYAPQICLQVDARMSDARKPFAPFPFAPTLKVSENSERTLTHTTSMTYYHLRGKRDLL
jgi:hypothetical protein